MDELLGVRDESGLVLCGCIQNNASEIGVALLNLATGCLSLKQFVDTSRSHRLLISELSAFDSLYILLCDTRVEYGVNSAVRAAAPMLGAECHLVKRAQFDDSAAQLLLQQLAESESSCPGVDPTTYLAIGAAGTASEYTSTATAHSGLHQVPIWQGQEPVTVCKRR